MHNARMSEFQKAREEVYKKLTTTNLIRQALNSIQETETEYLLDVFQIIKEYREDIQQKDLVDRYIRIVSPQSMNTKPSLKLDNEICKVCNEYYESVEGYDTCYNCGACENNLHYSETLSYKESQEIVHKHFNYDKSLHLADHLDRLQSKENKVIPTELLEVIRYELKKERITDYSNLAESKVKSILKKLKMHEYYDNVINIINRLSGRPPFVLTPEVSDKIKEMFIQIQYPFQLYKPPNRKNFLSYSYFLNKFFLILKLPEFAKYFPLLKSDDKLKQQDDIFCKIVKHMQKVDDRVDWQFYPSF